MISSLGSLLLVFIFLPGGISLFGQNPDAIFNHIEGKQLILNSENMVFYQPVTSTSYTWPQENDSTYRSLFGVFVTADFEEGGSTLLLAEEVEDLLNGQTAYSGAHEYTIQVLKPAVEGTSILNLTFLGIHFNQGSGLMLFNTISPTGFDNPNKLDVQTGHIQIEFGVIFKMTYLKNTCEEISASIKTTW